VPSIYGEKPGTAVITVYNGRPGRIETWTCSWAVAVRRVASPWVRGENKTLCRYDGAWASRGAEET